MNALTPLLTRLGALGLSATFAFVPLAGCEKKAIPPRAPATGPATQAGGAAADERPAVDPRTLLEGGELVFEDDFERATFGDAWKTDHAGWVIEGGWAHSTRARNDGLWLTRELPDETRVEFDARSEPLPGGKPFPGDLKAEIFAERPEHEAGYILVNGGWTNRLDIIARQDEHGDDRKEQAAAKVEPSKTYRWAIARAGDTVYWFRDGQLHMSYQDANPVRGNYFGFNNWEANVYFDNLKVYALE